MSLISVDVSVLYGLEISALKTLHVILKFIFSLFTILLILIVVFTGEVISEKYILEYGRDCLEMHVGAVKSGERALVVDDLIATGGTLCAAMNLLGKPVSC
jgi:hypoxanthine phosphoribosyltransferase